MNNFDEDVAKWLSLSNTGKFDEAKDFYFETLLTSSMRHPNHLLWYPFRTIA